MNFRKMKNLQPLLFVFVFIISLVSLGKVTFAWIGEAARHVTETVPEMSIETEEQISFSQLYVLRYNLEKTTVIEKHNPNSIDLKLDAYDTVFADRNDYLGIVVKITEMGIPNGTNPVVVISRTLHSDFATSNYISKIVNFKCVALEIPSGGYTTPATEYKAVTEALESTSAVNFLGNASTVSVPIQNVTSDYDLMKYNIYILIDYRTDNDISGNIAFGTELREVDYLPDIDSISFASMQ